MFKEILKENAPEIFVGIGILGIVATAVLTAKAVPKAQKHLNEALDKKINDTNNVDAELTTIEKVKAVGLDYAIPAGAAIGTAASFCTSYSMLVKEISFLSLAYNGVALALEDKASLNEKLKNALGEKKAEKIREEHDIERCVNTYANLADEKWIRSTLSKGDVPIIDLVTGAKFIADKNTVDAAFNRFNVRLQDEMEMTPADLLFEMGIDEYSNTFGLSDKLYWEVHNTRFLLPHWGTMEDPTMQRPVYTLTYDYPTKLYV